MTVKGGKNREYTEPQITAFLELAALEGIGPAIRELGYPTFPTATRWAKARGVDVSQSSVMEQARKAHTFYETEDLVQTIEETIGRISNDIRTKPDITADDFQKYATAISKMVDKHLILKGKAASISETRTGDTTDTYVAELIAQFDKNDNTTSSGQTST